MASIFVNDWDWRAAEQEFQRALELNPNYTVARLWYGLFLVRLKRFQEALEQTELGLSVDPFDPILASNNAVFLAELGRHEEAIARLQRMLELDPNSWGARSNLAGIYVRLDRYEEALEQYEGRARPMGWHGCGLFRATRPICEGSCRASTKPPAGSTSRP